jgi:nucleotide-binding universal stress UspA family protein
MTIRSILVADDMLDVSQPALEEAIQMAKLSGAKLSIVTVVAMISPSFGVPVPMGDSYVALLEDAKKRLTALKARIVSEGVPEVETALLEGDAVDRVVEYAEKHRPDLIVVGSRGLSTTGRFLLGSVSDGILHHAHCSVLVVKSTSGAKKAT